MSTSLCFTTVCQDHFVAAGESIRREILWIFRYFASTSRIAYKMHVHLFGDRGIARIHLGILLLAKFLLYVRVTNERARIIRKIREIVLLEQNRHVITLSSGRHRRHSHTMIHTRDTVAVKVLIERELATRRRIARTRR